MRLDFAELVNSLPTRGVLEYLGQEIEDNGTNVKVPCTECGKPMTFTATGNKKNLGYCPQCKKGKNILQHAALVSQKPIRQIAEELSTSILKLREPSNHKLQLTYKLYHHPDFNRQLQEELEFGICEKNRILSGHLAFAVYSVEGDRIAYVGKNLKTGAWKYPKNFNPELTLYNIHRIEGQWVYVFDNIESCICFWSFGIPAVSTFQGKMLTQPQYKLLERFNFVTMINVYAMQNFPRFQRVIDLPTKEEEIPNLF